MTQDGMERHRFEQLVAEVLDSLPARFRARLENIVVVVEDVPQRRKGRPWARPGELTLGVFQGVPRTRKSFFNATPPDRVVLYQKNIEAVCSTEDQVREQVRLTLLHELGHYFGLSEAELRHL